MHHTTAATASRITEDLIAHNYSPEVHRIRIVSEDLDDREIDWWWYTWKIYKSTSIDSIEIRQIETICKKHGMNYAIFPWVDMGFNLQSAEPKIYVTING